MTEQVVNSKAAPGGKLLRLLEIKRVIHIDDRFSKGYQTTDIMADQEIIPAATLQKIAPGIGNVTDDPDVRGVQFEKYWNDLPFEKRKELAEKIKTEADKIDSENSGDIESIGDLADFFHPIEYKPLGKLKWESDEQSLLSERTLLLIDQDLSGEEGGHKEEGMKILSSIGGSKKQDHVYLCLLTGTATMDNQNRKWEEFSEKFGVDRDRFFVIAKSQTSDVEEFTKRLRFALLTPDFYALREAAHDIMKKALDEANNRLKEISIVDFDHMVLRVPFAEGIWEPDVLFRLYGIFHREASQNLAYSEAKLEEKASKLRKVSHFEATKSKATDRVRSIEHKSRYDGNTMINKHLSPIQLGDLFRIEHDGGSEEYMLLSQPCDLALRSGTGKRKLTSGHLVQVEACSKSKLKNLSYHHLPYYEKKAGQEYALNFLNTRMIDLYILDLCAFNKTGECSHLNLTSSDCHCPVGVVPAMEKRFEYVNTEIKSLIERHKITNIDEDDLRAGMELRLSNIFKALWGFGPTFSPDKVSFPVSRIKRLQFEYATEALRLYAGYMCRTAFDVDLGRDAKAPER